MRLAGQTLLKSSFWWLISGQKAIAAKEQWKELKATYQEHVEAITTALTQALPKMEEAQRKQAQLQEALDQLQAKVHQGEGRIFREEEGKDKHTRLHPLSTFQNATRKIHSSSPCPHSLLTYRSKWPWRNSEQPRSSGSCNRWVHPPRKISLSTTMLLPGLSPLPGKPSPPFFL